MSRYVTLCHVWPPAGAGQPQRGEGDVVHAGLGGLHRDPGQLVHRHGARLARQVAVELLPVLVPPAPALEWRLCVFSQPWTLVKNCKNCKIWHVQK